MCVFNILWFGVVVCKKRVATLLSERAFLDERCRKLIWGVEYGVLGKGAWGGGTSASFVSHRVKIMLICVNSEHESKARTMFDSGVKKYLAYVTKYFSFSISVSLIKIFWWLLGKDQTSKLDLQFALDLPY